jgi:hypothetical protein
VKLNSLKCKGLAMVLVGSLAAFPLSAGLIPGLPDLVWDPIQDGHMVTALAHDLQMIAQLAQEVQMMQYNIRAFPSQVKGTFRGYTQPFYRPSTGNVFGETAAWANMAAGALYSTQEVRNAWEQSGVRLNPSPLLRNNLLNSTAVNRLANVEISDAAAINALQTVNAVRNQQSVNESAIRNLQSNCLNSSNDTQAMQANCASATGILNAQSAQTTNALLSSVVDLNAAQIKQRRDEEAKRINRESRVLEYQATERTNAVFSPDAMRRFKFQF